MIPNASPGATGHQPIADNEQSPSTMASGINLPPDNAKHAAMVQPVKPDNSASTVDSLMGSLGAFSSGLSVHLLPTLCHWVSYRAKYHLCARWM